MLRTADLHYAQTRALAARAVREARRGDAVRVVVRHQAASALVVTSGVSAMLAEQGTPVSPESALVPLGFTSAPEAVASMVEQADTDWRFERLVAGLVTDAARAAESVSIATRPRVGFVRYVSAPCCSRCAILAGRFYRWSDGFKRHPGCDCTHLPTTDPRSAYQQNPSDLVERGLVTGLSKADQKALAQGADLNQLVNVRSTKAGLLEGGQALARGGRLTPAGIYASTNGDRDAALALLAANGYIR